MSFLAQSTDIPPAQIQMALPAQALEAVGGVAGLAKLMTSLELDIDEDTAAGRLGSGVGFLPQASRQQSDRSNSNAYRKGFRRHALGTGDNISDRLKAALRIQQTTR